VVVAASPVSFLPDAQEMRFRGMDLPAVVGAATIPDLAVVITSHAGL